MGHLPLTIIAPCFNESQTVVRFLERLESVLSTLPYTFSVVVVDDGSTDDTPLLLQKFTFQSTGLSLEIISLPENLGHQAAIYEGLVYAHALTGDHFIIMDADGEDSPSAIPALLKHTDADIVHVVRNKRRESLFFRFCYYVYKAIFRALTGKRMNFGNFCLISRPVLELAVQSEFAHFAAFLSKQRCTTRYVLADKEARIGGTSKMGFVKLFRHAVRSFSEYRTNNSRLLFKRSV
jgi:polyisoprenyl-phosphate glycosyltransferase